MLRCNDVSKIIAADELEGASWTRKLAVRMHILMCAHCRRYERQLKEIARAAKSVLGGRDSDPDPEVTRHLEAKILDKLPKGDDPPAS